MTDYKGKKKIEKKKMAIVMDEFKDGKLKSGSGAKVKSKPQAVAIGISEAKKKGK